MTGPVEKKAKEHARDPLTWCILIVGLVNLAAHLPEALDSAGKVL